jgi:HEPN domain-containing protein
VVLGHAVGELARRCTVHDPGFGNLLEEGALLDQFYIPTRYPNGLPAPAIPSDVYTQTQAEAAQRAAERVLETAEAFLRARTDLFR